MKRKFPLGLLIVVGLVALFVGWGLYRNSTIGTRFEGINVGESDVQVRHLMGRPSRIEPCGKSFGVPSQTVLNTSIATHSRRSCPNTILSGSMPAAT